MLLLLSLAVRPFTIEFSILNWLYWNIYVPLPTQCRRTRRVKNIRGNGSAENRDTHIYMHIPTYWETENETYYFVSKQFNRQLTVKAPNVFHCYLTVTPHCRNYRVHFLSLHSPESYKCTELMLNSWCTSILLSLVASKINSERLNEMVTYSQILTIYYKGQCPLIHIQHHCKFNKFKLYMYQHYQQTTKQL